jgi:hypothetical protein
MMMWFILLLVFCADDGFYYAPAAPAIGCFKSNFKCRVSVQR